MSCGRVGSSHARLLFGQASGRLKRRADQRSAPTKGERGPTVRTHQGRSYRHPPMYAVISASASTCRNCATDARRIGFSSTGDSGAWRSAS